MMTREARLMSGIILIVVPTVLNRVDPDTYPPAQHGGGAKSVPQPDAAMAPIRACLARLSSPERCDRNSRTKDEAARQRAVRLQNRTLNPSYSC
jgi:hypothetical protein